MRSFINKQNKKNKSVKKSKVQISNKVMNSSDGMSLVEIVVALALLAIIMFFMASTQMNSLKMNHKTGIIRELTHNAEREIEVRRQQPRESTEIVSSAPDCQFVEEEDYVCTTAIHPCSIVTNASGENTIACVNTNAANFPEAEAVSHQIVIDIVGPEERNIRLQTIVEANKSE